MTTSETITHGAAADIVDTAVNGKLDPNCLIDSGQELLTGARTGLVAEAAGAIREPVSPRTARRASRRRARSSPGSARRAYFLATLAFLSPE